jgi:hypothetical protein
VARSCEISQEDQKNRRFNCSPRLRRATPHQTGGGSANPKCSPFLSFCPSDLPVKISIEQSGPDSPQQLLQLGLHFGSQEV